MFLQLFQSWALGFKSKESLSFFVDVYNELKNAGTSCYSAPLAFLTRGRHPVSSPDTGQRCASVNNDRADMG